MSALAVNQNQFEPKQAILSGGIEIQNTKVGTLGLTFKENCPDLRYSKVVDIIHELRTYGIQPLVNAPLADLQQVFAYSDIELSDWQDFQDLGALIIAVPHQQYAELSLQDFSVP